MPSRKRLEWMMLLSSRCSSSTDLSKLLTYSEWLVLCYLGNALALGVAPMSGSLPLPQFSSFSAAAAQADLSGPVQVTSLQAAQRERRTSALWKCTAVALGALAFFVPLPAGAALLGGCVWAIRKGIHARERSQVLQIEAVRAAVADLELAAGPDGSEAVADRT
jgi:hypothetical protein